MKEARRIYGERADLELVDSPWLPCRMQTVWPS
jgi:hypothetical protein